MYYREKNNNIIFQYFYKIAEVIISFFIRHLFSFTFIIFFRRQNKYKSLKVYSMIVKIRLGGDNEMFRYCRTRR